MTGKDNPKAGITKRETKKGSTGIILEEKYLSVEGENLSKVKKVFEEEWEK